MSRDPGTRGVARAHFAAAVQHMEELTRRDPASKAWAAERDALRASVRTCCRR